MNPLINFFLCLFLAVRSGGNAIELMYLQQKSLRKNCDVDIVFAVVLLVRGRRMITIRVYQPSLVFVVNLTDCFR